MTIKIKIEMHSKIRDTHLPKTTIFDIEIEESSQLNGMMQSIKLAANRYKGNRHGP